MQIHFVGIGGIGLSGLARYMQKNGHKVIGSDIANTKLTELLKSEGIEVNIPHSASNISNQNLVVHTAVAKPDNPELVEAKKEELKYLAEENFYHMS